jgi:hypothetical protein
MSVTYMFVDIVYNVVLPICIANYGMHHGERSGLFPKFDQNWRISMQLLSDIRTQFVLAFNMQMVYFYYKLSLPSGQSEMSSPLSNDKARESIIQLRDSHAVRNNYSD